MTKVTTLIFLTLLILISKSTDARRARAIHSRTTVNGPRKKGPHHSHWRQLYHDIVSERPNRSPKFGYDYAHNNQFQYPYGYSAEAMEDHWPSVSFIAAPGEIKSSKQQPIITQSTGSTGHIDRELYKNQQNHNSVKDFGPVDVFVPYTPKYNNNPVITTHKPIIESLPEFPQNTGSVNKLVKAAIEPVAIFKTFNHKDQDKDKDKDSQADTGKYEFEYVVEDAHFGTHFGHREYHDKEKTKGKYQVVLPDGRLQTVNYYSDPSGFHPSISYEHLYQKHEI